MSFESPQYRCAVELDYKVICITDIFLLGGLGGREYDCIIASVLSDHLHQFVRCVPDRPYCAGVYVARLPIAMQPREPDLVRPALNVSYFLHSLPVHGATQV